jgi:hypothetical protein
MDVTEDLLKMLSKDYGLVNRFKLKGVEDGFIPILEDISFGEFIDLDNHLGNWKTMHKAMSVLYRPIVKQKEDRYTIKEYEGTNNDLREMPLDIVFGSLVFFYHLSQELMKVTLNYLSTGKELDLDQQAAFQQNGDGISQSLHSLRETLQGLNISLD